MSLFFTADSHFGHKAMVNKYREGFSSLEEMDELLIERWNSVVGLDDEVWHLGDVSFYGSNKTMEILNRLNGKKNLTWGNHDHKRRGPWTTCFDTVESYKELKIDGRRIVLFHFPIASFHDVGAGSWHLHGHSHGNLPPTDMARLDVGVDDHNWTPWSYEEVAEVLKDRIGMPGDHHEKHVDE